jgi:hypothetical protein
MEPGAVWPIYRAAAVAEMQVPAAAVEIPNLLWTAIVL